MVNKKRLLFLCTGNSCRSQMAEGWARRLIGETFDVFSAGTSPQPLNPFAVRVMAETGIDISSHRAKNVDELGEMRFDCVITVCQDAHEQCPVWTGRGRVMHHAFDDPPRLAAVANSEDERLAVYRRVRDEIRDFVSQIPAIVDL